MIEKGESSEGRGGTGAVQMTRQAQRDGLKGSTGRMRHAGSSLGSGRGALDRAVVRLVTGAALLLVLWAHAAEAAEARKGMVATASPLATEAGLDALRAGGNAVDAAVAAAYAIGVVEPHASGIGGEGVMLIYLAESREVVVVDYKSMAPGGLDPASPMPRSGYPSAAVPGTVAGLDLALRRFGTLPREQVMAPAIRLADEGFEVSPTVAVAVLDHFVEIVEDEALASVLCPGGLPAEVGQQMRNPDLAKTLRAIATEGPDGFYKGRVARAIAAAAADGGSNITLEDLEAYSPVVRTPIEARYRGHTVYSTPGPTGGLAVLENLRMLTYLRPARHRPQAPETVHLVAEVTKRGLADHRAFVGDPAFTLIPTRGLLRRSYTRGRARQIRPDVISEKVEPGRPDGAESASTTSLVVADRAGNLVALTQTLSDRFGARVMVPGTGVILNDEMKNFSTEGPNVYAPGKRPRTSIAPTLVVRRGRPVAAFATPGSSRILTTTTLIAMNLLDHGMGIQEAIDAPRYFVRTPERLLHAESRLPETAIAALEKLGYHLRLHGELDPFFGGAQGVAVDRATGLLTGAADPRRDGSARGH